VDYVYLGRKRRKPLLRIECHIWSCVKANGGAAPITYLLRLHVTALTCFNIPSTDLSIACVLSARISTCQHINKASNLHTPDFANQCVNVLFYLVTAPNLLYCLQQ
jgi:hypothetical protein